MNLGGGGGSGGSGGGGYSNQNKTPVEKSKLFKDSMPNFLVLEQFTHLKDVNKPVQIPPKA